MSRITYCKCYPAHVQPHVCRTSKSTAYPKILLILMLLLFPVLQTLSVKNPTVAHSLSLLPTLEQAYCLHNVNRKAIPYGIYSNKGACAFWKWLPYYCVGYYWIKSAGLTYTSDLQPLAPGPVSSHGSFGTGPYTTNEKTDYSFFLMLVCIYFIVKTNHLFLFSAFESVAVCFMHW